ncbi:hypothetical protein ACTXT7_004211 [Hymenolepis weldensis]
MATLYNSLIARILFEWGFCSSETHEATIMEKHVKKSSNRKLKHSSSWPLCKRLLSCCHRNSQYHRQRHSSKHRRGLQGCCSRESGNFLTTFYCLVKCLYLINAVGQIYLMERFVGARVTFYGAAVLTDLIRGRDWQQSGHFPRVLIKAIEEKGCTNAHISKPVYDTSIP